MTENDIVKACLEILNAYKIFCWRNNTGGFRTEKGFYRFGFAGSPDIIAIRKGIFIGIECKYKTKQSPKQKEFQEMLEIAGGKYWLINNPDELIKLLKD